jgi:colanic acid/amylovoran biosynthesis glycosyltransferase
MKIGYFVPEFPSQTHVFFWRQVVALRALGTEVCLLSTRRPRPTACRHEFAETAARQTHYVFPPRWGATLAALATRPVALLRCLAYVHGLRETPLRQRLIKLGLILAAADLLVHCRRLGLEHVHSHSCADSAHVVALCHLLGGPPYSLSLHGDLTVYGTDHASKMARARFISCDSAHLRQQITAAVGISPERLPLELMGVDTDHFADNGSRSPRQGHLHAVTVARLNPCKGHRHALAAIRLAVDCGCAIRYTIAGDGPARTEIEDEIRRLGLTECVCLTGTLSEVEILRVLQQADVFILPSVGLGESNPVAVKEAMACGLPVISSRIGGTTNMITDGVDGFLVEQGDEQAIAGALVQLANDPEERSRIGREARARAVRDFDSRRTSQALLDAIRRSREPLVGNRESRLTRSVGDYKNVIQVGDSTR